ncbi:hypothetical protein [Embleya sp. NPDC005971]|uniref:hypothetical protein n=1 Tax=Embleya sp. NPDC005971 TaxID=3156724 RepID=UPI0033E5A1BF
MAQPQPDWKLLDYEYDPGLLRARYELPDGSWEFQTFAVPEHTLPALVAALLAHADQNERTDILRDEVARNDEIMSKRYAAMPGNVNPPSWLPAFMRGGNTLR